MHFPGVAVSLHWCGDGTGAGAIPFLWDGNNHVREVSVTQHEGGRGGEKGRRCCGHLKANRHRTCL